jgi:hypothetical protein
MRHWTSNLLKGKTSKMDDLLVQLAYINGDLEKTVIDG